MKTLLEKKEKNLMGPSPTLNISLDLFFIKCNLDLTKCQGIGEIGSLYRGSVPYILLWLG